MTTRADLLMDQCHRIFDEARRYERTLLKEGPTGTDDGRSFLLHFQTLVEPSLDSGI